MQSLAQSGEGFLWIGTQEGLVRFDGVEFRTWGSRQVPEMTSSSVVSLAVGGTDTLWLGTTAGGVLRKQGQVWTAWTERQGLLSNAVTAMVVDELGDLWVGTDKGLSRISGGGVTPDSVLLPKVEDLLLDHQGHLWVGTRRGVFRLEHGGAPQAVTELEGLAVLDLHLGRDGSIWMGTASQGLLRWDGAGLERWGPDQGLDSAGVRALVGDPDGNLWIGTTSSGLLRLGEDGRLSGPVSGLLSPTARVESLLVDGDESLWVGSFTEGLYRLRDTPFQMLASEDGLSEDLVWTIHEEAPGHLWIGGVGLSKVEHGRVVPWEGQEELEGLHITSVLTDRSGALWAGTTLAGLFRWKDGSWTHWTTAEGLPDLDVFSLALDPRGSVWAGTRGGLVRMGESGVEVWGTDEGLPSDHVRAVYFDPEGTLWVGTYAGGAARMTGSAFVPVPGTEKLRPGQRVVLALHRDGEGVLWMGTQGGLVRWDGEHLGSVGWHQGLPDDNVYAILEDHAGQLWMSSNQGVYSASVQELTQVAKGEQALILPRVFGKSDGLRSTECNGGTQPAAIRTSDGRMWFATVAGAASVDLLALEEPPRPARTLVERFVADNRPMPLDEPIRLDPGSHRIEVEYTAPTLVTPDQISFQVRLEGAEDDWRVMGSDRDWNRNGLDPGRYELRVRACHPRGGCGEASEAVRFSIRPHLWETLPFYLLVGLALIGVGVGVGALRARQLRARARALQEAVAQRTAELHHLTEELRELSLKDPLTGLRNRRYLIEALEPLLDERCQVSSHAERRRAWPDDVLVLCILDLDHFKRVNDAWGHDAGDKALEQIARILRELTRPGDIVTRWGGEEFVVVLPSVPPSHVAAFARRLRQSVASHDFKLLGDRSIRLTCSVGVATVPFGEPGLGITVDRLVGLADAALYKAKRDGRNAAFLVTPGESWTGTREDLLEAVSDPESALYSKKLVMERLG